MVRVVHSGFYRQGFARDISTNEYNLWFSMDSIIFCCFPIQSLLRIFNCFLWRFNLGEDGICSIYRIHKRKLFEHKRRSLDTYYHAGFVYIHLIAYIGYRHVCRQTATRLQNQMLVINYREKIDKERVDLTSVKVEL